MTSTLELLRSRQSQSAIGSSPASSPASRGDQPHHPQAPAPASAVLANLPPAGPCGQFLPQADLFADPENAAANFCGCPMFWLDPYGNLHCRSCSPPARASLMRHSLAVLTTSDQFEWEIDGRPAKELLAESEQSDGQSPSDSAAWDYFESPSRRIMQLKRASLLSTVPPIEVNHNEWLERGNALYQLAVGIPKEISRPHLQKKINIKELMKKFAPSKKRGGRRRR